MTPTRAPRSGPVMGVFADHAHPTIARRIIGDKNGNATAMRKILGGISHQSGVGRSPEKRKATATSTSAKRVLFPGSTRNPSTQPSSTTNARTPGKKAREPSTSPNGGFFSHPAFKAYKRSPGKTVSVRRRLSSPVKSGVKPGVVGARKVEERQTNGPRSRLLCSSDDEGPTRKIASSSTGAHPSSDHDHHGDLLRTAVDEPHPHFADLVKDLPPSSPPVFDAHMDLSPAAHSGRGALSSSPVQQLASPPPTSQAKKRKSAEEHAPPGARLQKPKVSARTLEGRDDLPVVRIRYDGTYHLVLGRSRRANRGEVADAQDSEVHPVPMTLSPGTADHLIPDAAKPAKLAPLPRTATHASRAHVLLQVVPQGEGDRLVLSVLGQNGCMIRRLPLTGTTTAQAAVRYPAGAVYEVSRARGEALRIEVDMYSCRAVVDWEVAPSTEEEEKAGDLVDQELAELLATPVVRKTVSRPPKTTGGKRVQTGPTPSPVRSIHSQMTYESDGEEDVVRPIVGAAALGGQDMSREVKKELVELAAAEAPVQRDPSAGRREGSVAAVLAESHVGSALAVPDVPTDIDLKALVATSLVFSGSSAISCPDLVKAILDSQPSMKSHGRESVWSVWVEDTLHSHPMFGRVDRKGKDASGKPLLPLFHYVPAEDYDRTRAAELGGLMRPLRGTQRGGGKAIDWRPVGGRRR